MLKGKMRCLVLSVPLLDGIPAGLSAKVDESISYDTTPTTGQSGNPSEAHIGIEKDISIGSIG
jgi:hypothetical protein